MKLLFLVFYLLLVSANENRRNLRVEFRRKLLELYEGDNLGLLADNVDWFFETNQDPFFDLAPMYRPEEIFFDSIFDSFTSSFMTNVPNYEESFNFLTTANSQLDFPYRDSEIHIFAQNSYVNSTGGVNTETFECDDRLPQDLMQSCHAMEESNGLVEVDGVLTVCCCNGIVMPTMQCYDDPRDCDFTNDCGTEFEFANLFDTGFIGNLWKPADELNPEQFEQNAPLESESSLFANFFAPFYTFGWYDDFHDYNYDDEMMMEDCGKMHNMGDNTMGQEQAAPGQKVPIQDDGGGEILYLFPIDSSNTKEPSTSAAANIVDSLNTRSFQIILGCGLCLMLVLIAGRRLCSKTNVPAKELEKSTQQDVDVVEYLDLDGKEHKFITVGGSSSRITTPKNIKVSDEFKERLLQEICEPITPEEITIHGNGKCIEL